MEKPNFLPDDLVLSNILTRLPSKYLIRCRCVCKRWSNSILHDPNFASRFLQKNPRRFFYNFVDPKNKINLFYLSEEEEEGDDESVNLLKIKTIGSEHKGKLVGYCNGLVCLFNEDAKIIEVCNPTRHEILAIVVHPDLVGYSTDKCYGYGIGFDSLTNEYKLVFLSHMFKCMVFTLGISNSHWREIAIDDNDVITQLSNNDDHPFESESAIFCNGGLYWIRKNRETISDLVWFDLHKEKFQVIQFPERFRRGLRPRLLVHRGSLCCVCIFKFFCRWIVMLFVLKDEGRGATIMKERIFLLGFHFSPEDFQVVDFFDQILMHKTDTLGQIYRTNLHKRKLIAVGHPHGLCPKEYACSYVTNHVDNFISLQTFVHQGVPKILDDYPPLESINILKQRSGPPGVAFLFLSSRNQQFIDN